VLRLVGFFFACIVLLNFLRAALGGVPVIGWILRIPLIGFWVVALGLSLFLTKFGNAALDRRKRAVFVRRLGAVDTPHNMGKLGSLFVAQGRHRSALPYLDRAVAGEPEVAEWHYRRGCAQFALRQLEPALASMQRALELDDEHAYGETRMMEARCLAGLGRHQEALVAFETLERYHGPSPESAYRRGVVLKALGRKEEARASLDEVTELARSGAKYQERHSAEWIWRARWARVL
jgi:tetratricopeptide (TPR) repeat protein